MAWVKVAKTSEIPAGEILSLLVGKQPVAIARIGAEFFAVGDTCTHAQCSLGEGTLVGTEVECPCHGSRFDVKTGAVRFLPATVPVKTYPLKVEGEEILIEI